MNGSWFLIPEMVTEIGGHVLYLTDSRRAIRLILCNSLGQYDKMYIVNHELCHFFHIWKSNALTGQMQYDMI